jgi:cystathionine beta-synthase
LEKEIPGGVILDQYGNPNNPAAHEFGTAAEIVEQTNNVEGKLAAVVAGAGTGGTITGISRGIRKAHGDKVKIVAADPQGSILAVPASLNDEHKDKPYKIEGIGYDFIPDVLSQKEVDVWYKTDDRDSFYWARRLISEEGLLCGGSSGSAMSACIKAIKEMNLTENDAVVVILPDSIRSYLSKFVDDDWLAANDLMPPQMPLTAPSTPPTNATQPAEPKEEGLPILTKKTSKDEYGDGKISDLRLKPIQTISETATVDEAIEMMRDKGYDQVPVTSTKGQRLVGMVTLGNCLSYLSSGRVTIQNSVSDVMFNFSKLDEIKPIEKNAALAEGDESKRQYVEITMNTPLRILERFLVWNAAAIVTEKDSNGNIKAKAIATKVDLLLWLVKQGRQSAQK